MNRGRAGREKVTAGGFARSPCAVAGTLDLIGDKWSLLVVRDLAHGKRTYGELQNSPERIPTNILAERLRRLEEAGIVAREPYQERPVRYCYTLTQKGRELGPILRALVVWGKQHVPGALTLQELAASYPEERDLPPRRRRGGPRRP
jgi:DNA-binding HxlR family transcriptional regulator